MDEDVTFDALHSFASIARELAAQPALTPVSQRIVDLAVKVVGCDAALLSRLSGTKLLIEAGTNPEISAAVEAIARTTHEGLTIEVVRKKTTVLCNDLEHDTRWAIAGPRGISETPIRSLVGFHLELDNQSLGALTLYSNEAEFFTAPLVELASVYADHAAIALGMAAEHAQVVNLTTALESNRNIGTAMGIVMVQYGVEQAVAFDLLRIASQRANRKLRTLADEIVAGGDASMLQEPLGLGRTGTDLHH